MKMLRYFNKSFALYSAFILSLFAIDRITKIYVIHLDRINLQNFILKSEYLNIRLFWNEGIAFGLLQLQEDNFYNILTTIIILIILIILFMILRNRGFRKFSLILIFSGALGNVYDRIFFKAVPDFIDFHIGEFHWFIFNVADIFITLGVVFMILLEIYENKKK
jgi:signal peptidase II